MLPVVLVSIIALAGSCNAWPSLISRPDAAFRANVLLIDTDPNAETLIQLIETAKGLISAKQIRSKSVGKILQALVGLEQIVQDSAKAKYTCDSDGVDRIAKIHQELEYFSRDGVYYLEPNSRRRLNEEVIHFQLEYAKVCLRRFKENYDEVYQKQPQKMRTALEYLAQLVDRAKIDIPMVDHDKIWKKITEAPNYKEGQRIPTGKSELIGNWGHVLTKLQNMLGDQPGLRRINPRNGLKEVDELVMRQYISSLVEHTCTHYEQQPEAMDILDNTTKLVASIKPTPKLITDIDAKLKQLAKHVLGMLVCKDMKVIDIDDLARRVSADVNKW